MPYGGIKMDKKSMYALSYGVFMVGSKSGDRTNGCITNTCIQVASNPTRVAISVLNTNYTCDLIKETGLATVSILDNTITYETIKHFGMQSGRDVDKMEGIPLPVDANGIPYMGWAACAVLSLKVVSSQDLGSHTLFVAEVTDGKVLSANEPVTYAYYQAEIKPKPEKVDTAKKIVGWRCKICKYVFEGSELPADFVCPLCGHGPEDFEPVYG